LTILTEITLEIGSGQVHQQVPFPDWIRNNVSTWKKPQVSTKEIACTQFREEGKGGGDYKASIFNYVRNSELQTDTLDENNTPSCNTRLKTRRLPRHIFIRIIQLVTAVSYQLISVNLM
jgi:hypothetical protein